MPVSLYPNPSFNTDPNRLLSDKNFDKVNESNKKPTVGSVGLVKNVDAGTSTNNGHIDSSIIRDVPNLHKHIGDFMSQNGFLKLPRSLLDNPHWQGMRLKYQKVFLTIFYHTAYTHKRYAIGEHIIHIEPGQFCTSIRNLVDLCNDGVKFQDEKIDKNIVERSVSLFTKIGLVRQEVRHRKSILTITYPEIYEDFKNQTETHIETRPRHNRDINEERKEREEDIKESIESTFENSEIESDEKKYVDENLSALDNRVEAQTQKSIEVETLWGFCQESLIADPKTHCGKPGVKKSDLEIWIKNFSYQEILNCLTKCRKAKIQKTYPAYVSKILKKDSSIEMGKQIVSRVVEKNGMHHIRLEKECFLDSLTGERISYHLPKNTLNQILRISFERLKNGH